MTTFIKTPFADAGDKATIPATDASGSVNWSQGFPADYSKDPDTDPSAKRIEREDFNGMMNTMTKAINEIQKRGIASFITAADNGGTAFVYESGIFVYYNGNVYQSIIPNNNSTPGTDITKWNLVATFGNYLGITQILDTGSFTPKANTRLLRVRIWGAGGSGAGTAVNGSGAGSGAGGAYMETFITIQGSGLTWPQPVTIGKGGNAIGANNNAAGVKGGDTRFGNVIIAGGGQGGGAGGGLGGTVQGGANVFSLTGQNGQGAVSGGLGGTGGMCPMGGFGGLPHTSIAGDGGGFPGGGGAGASYGSGGNPQASGAGGNGYCLIEEWS